jgi:hypothetical protein
LPTTETLPAGITLTPFKADDAFAMSMTEQAMRGFTGVDLRENFELYERKGPGWTMRVGDDIVGCAGLMFPWPSGSFAVAWLLPSPLLPSYPKTVVLTVLTRLRALMREYQPRRVEFMVQSGFAVGMRFAEFMGFVRDGCCDAPCERCGLVRSYGPKGEDYYRYVWIRPDA